MIRLGRLGFDPVARPAPVCMCSKAHKDVWVEKEDQGNRKQGRGRPKKESGK